MLKKTDFIDPATEFVEKTLVSLDPAPAQGPYARKTISFIVKPVPATASNQQPATVHGFGVCHSLTRLEEL